MRSTLAYRWAFVLLAFSLLLTQHVAGSHLHLCFDGQEPPVQVHLIDAPGKHGTEHVAMQHVDRDVPLAGDTATRDKSSTPDLPPILPTSWRTGTLPVHFVVVDVFVPSISFPSQQIHELLPPSRGPPLTARA